MLNLYPLRVFGIVTIPTGNFRVLAIQVECCPVVVKRHRPPIRFVMAIQTIRLGIEFLRNEALMLTLVAIRAFFPDVSEMPFARLLMA